MVFAQGVLPGWLSEVDGDPQSRFLMDSYLLRRANE